MIVGTEWLIEATGCDTEPLRDENAIRGILSRVIADLGLRSIGSVWHKFEGEGGVTGLVRPGQTGSAQQGRNFPIRRNAVNRTVPLDGKLAGLRAFANRDSGDREKREVTLRFESNFCGGA